jgi:beta-1,4-mannosyltransferase
MKSVNDRKMSANDIRVVLLPWSSANPYQSLLTNSKAFNRGYRFFAIHIDQISRSPRKSVLHLLKIRPQIVHLHWTHPFFLHGSKIVFRRLVAFTLAIGWLKFRGTKIVWTAHNFVNHAGHAPTLDRLVSKLICRFADRVILHSNYAKRKFLDSRLLRDSSRTEIISHGNYLKSYDCSMTRSAAREQLDIAEDVFLILVFGALRRNRNLDLIIAAFQLLSSEPEGRSWQLKIAGPCWDKSLVEELRIRSKDLQGMEMHTEFQTDENTSKLCRASDVGVVFSNDGLTSGVAHLYASMGLAIMTTQSFSESFEYFSKGVLTVPDNASALEIASCLKGARENRSALVAMGASNYKASQLLDWDRIASKTRSVYESTLSESSPT